MAMSGWSLRSAPIGSAASLRVEPRSVPWWLLAAVAPMLMSEIVRLRLLDPLAWIACDYVGRIIALSVLVVVPAARRIAFAGEPMRRWWWEVALWVIGLVAFDRIVDHAVSDAVNTIYPGTRLGEYPSPRGLLFAVDISIGLALVAYSEEVIFRRCARVALAKFIGDGWAIVLVTAALFAAYHWWSGVGNIAATMLFGVAAMLCYRRLGVLSPVVLAHYLCDAANFS
jgi:membrane protease YdiL (CAAX protease family)